MAGRRAAMKSIDWGMFNALKTRSDAISAKLVSLPETPATIDWSHYRSTVAKAGMVDEFEKKKILTDILYCCHFCIIICKSFTFPKQNKSASAYIEGSKARICSLDNFKNMIPFDQMTIEDLNHTFPETKLDKVKYPYWPHKPIADL
uniref:ATP synthase peripheral stalk subunit d n=1 Tax=Cyclopterus lumpus TaxID=8103 RepID=A0A8C2YVP3_CYCLU